MEFHSRCVSLCTIVHRVCVCVCLYLCVSYQTTQNMRVFFGSEEVSGGSHNINGLLRVKTWF